MKTQWAVVRLVGSCAIAVVSSWLELWLTAKSASLSLTSHLTEAKAWGQAQTNSTWTPPYNLWELVCNTKMSEIPVFNVLGEVSGCSVPCALRRKFAAALLPRLFGNNVPGHTTRAPPVGFELATNGVQFYAIANLDKTSLRQWSLKIRDF